MPVVVLASWLCLAQPSAASVGTHETTLAAAGDITCDPATSRTATTCQDAATAALVSAAHPDRVLAIGDLQYTNGALASFLGEYDPVWGAFKATTLPVPGNHEYLTSGASGYFDYWGAQAGERSQGWYATRLGSWLIVSLNSNCASIGGCGRSSPQGVWLESQLQSSTATCQLAYWHHPRFSSGLHGDNVGVQPLWEILQEHQAELVLAGHDHEFERFEPMLADATLSSSGMPSYVIGTGGVDLRDFGIVRAGSAVRIKKFGIGLIDLYANGWAAEFRATDGTTASDGVTHECVAPTVAEAASAPSAPPTPVPKKMQTATRIRPLHVKGAAVLPPSSKQGLALTWSSRTRTVCTVYMTLATHYATRRVVTRVKAIRRGTCKVRGVNQGSATLEPATITITIRVS